MSRRLAAVIVAFVALGAIAALLLLRDGDSGGDSLARMSADGEPIAMDVPQHAGLLRQADRRGDPDRGAPGRALPPAARRGRNLELRGFAADGVKRIGALDAAGRVRPPTDVVDNVFTAPPPSRVRGIAALDEDGEIVWRSDVIPE
jgi:hypothetical protein